jgi:hypothetical protein
VITLSDFGSLAAVDSLFVFTDGVVSSPRAQTVCNGSAPNYHKGESNTKNSFAAFFLRKTRSARLNSHRKVIRVNTAVLHPTSGTCFAIDTEQPENCRDLQSAVARIGTEPCAL